MITKNLDCSTGHISRGDNEKLKTCVRGLLDPIVVYHYLEGYFVYVSDDVEEQGSRMEKEGYSSAFINLIKLARKSGCKYLQLDCDGTTYPELPTFNW